MKRFSLLCVLLLISGLLISSCGGISDPINEPPANNSNEPGNDELPVEDEPGLPQEHQGPIVNLPGETPFQDLEPAPGQAKLVEGEAFVSNAQVVVMESFPVQVSLAISGELPTPCNKLTIDISEPDENNRIMVEVYSLIDPAETCIAVIENFSANFSLPVDGLEDGSYEVWVNGELAGEFNYPG